MIFSLSDKKEILAEPVEVASAVCERKDNNKFLCSMHSIKTQQEARFDDIDVVIGNHKTTVDDKFISINRSNASMVCSKKEHDKGNSEKINVLECL